MIRYTTFKLINIASDDLIFSSNHVNTSDSVLSQQKKDVPYITDQFGIIKMQTVAHSWFSAEEHARKILCKIAKSDYELISFKKKQLDAKLSDKSHLQF